jgi:hypothetical protein
MAQGLIQPAKRIDKPGVLVGPIGLNKRIDIIFIQCNAGGDTIQEFFPAERCSDLCLNSFLVFNSGFTNSRGLSLP